MRLIAVLTLLTFLLSNNLCAQTCDAKRIKPTTPSKKFLINDNGTVTDKRSKLMWKLCLEGLSGEDCSIGTSDKVNWITAAFHPTKLKRAGENFAGFDDWYLPNVKELETLVEGSCYDPALNLEIFPSMEGIELWSRSKDHKKLGYAWGVDFYGGYPFYSKYDYKAAMRLVRNTKKPKKKNKKNN